MAYFVYFAIEENGCGMKSAKVNTEKWFFIQAPLL